MAMIHWRVVFETVSPFRFPHLYHGPDGRFSGDLAQLPSDAWHWVTTDHKAGEDHAREQYVGLLKLATEGEPIRNVRLEAATEPRWITVAEDDRMPER